MREEWPGILRWMVEGCLDWQASRLARPETVRAATEAYFSDRDLSGQWLDEDCDAEPGNSYKWETTAKLFLRWSEYAQRAGKRAGSKKGFSEAMQRRAFESFRRPKARASRGIQLTPTMTHGGS